ncbi:hypothetical protein BO94DRAFT_556471 [Aspergillus sclerotioniger CBS 115572]|uniref:Ubiquitin-conjugating enzyme E2-binding protein n=1 Tax=Aspergillus sclerotioniger CBS 115572 TaxID=1450535 RepID=A0A317WPR7_9EURO|nr:hypothetical protein BO94DRAFT_556471 [Aspergillus sclerotioniger CBS 115572]PWY88025.1 hypothetical protein BO94DRAFT_556471 [Aspergillus sclerotioniger CBS 115572]
MDASFHITDLTITLSDTRRSISVSLHNDDPVTLKLPARVTQTSHRILHLHPSTLPQTQPGAKQGQYSFRMQVDETDNDNAALFKVDDTLDGFVPWTATDMSPATRLRCLACGEGVLDEGKVWKDLPSGNWAEMMDFWHCHKPDLPKEAEKSEGDGEDPNALVKGYGAANQVVAMEGSVLVDIPNEDTTPTTTTINCSTCSTQLGIHDPITTGHRLFKTRLSASSTSSTSTSPDEPTTTTTTTWSHHPPETIISAQLLELIERESTRRFILHHDHKTGLLIWIFNPTLHYSNSTPTHSISSQRAMKVFFRDLTEGEIEDMLHPQRGSVSSLAVEEVRLLREEFLGFRDVLRGSNGLLPVEARVFREWRVGLVGRFERNY